MHYYLSKKRVRTFWKVVKRLCPHHVGHYLGMDVHDSESVSKNLSLQEGMVITVEPGIYVQNDEDIPSRLVKLELFRILFSKQRQKPGHEDNRLVS